MSRKISIILFVLLVLGIILGGFLILKNNKQVVKNCPKINEGSQIVIMREGAFEPETLTIQKCTKVIFKNQDKVARWPASNLHPTHGIYPEFDPRVPVEIGKDWFFVFDKPGNWKYHDHLFPSIRGVIIVSE